MNISTKSIRISIYVALGFLTMLLIPFDQLLLNCGLNEFQSEYLGDTLNNLVVIAVGMLLIRRFGYIKVAGMQNWRPQRLFLLLIPLYFLFAGPVQYHLTGVRFENINPTNVFFLFLSTITVGLSEEIIFRGFILPHLIRGTRPGKSLLFPIFLSAAMFGVLHLLNLLANDSSVVLVLSQVVYATMFGVGFAVILLRTTSIYPIGIIHGLINFSSKWDDLPAAIEPPNIAIYRVPEAVLSIAIVLPFFIYMLLQTQKIDKKAVDDLYTVDIE